VDRLDERRRQGRLSDAEFEALASSAAERAAGILISKLEYAATWGKKIVHALLWVGWAISAALAAWHHEALTKIVFG